MTPSLRAGGFMLLFAALAAAFVLGLDGAGEWHGQWLVRTQAHHLAWCLGVLGHPVTVTGYDVLLPTVVFRVLTECTGIHGAALFAAAVLAYPAPWKKKLRGLAVGVPLLLLLNDIRLVSLGLIAIRFPDLVLPLHLYFWQVTLMMVFLVFWFVWLRWAAEPRTPSRAAVD